MGSNTPGPTVPRGQVRFNFMGGDANTARMISEGLDPFNPADQREWKTGQGRGATRVVTPPPPPARRV